MVQHTATSGTVRPCRKALLVQYVNADVEVLTVTVQHPSIDIIYLHTTALALLKRWPTEDRFLAGSSPGTPSKSKVSHRRRRKSS